MPKKSVITLPLDNQRTLSVFVRDARLLCPAEVKAVEKAEKQLRLARQDRDPVAVAQADQELQRCLAELLQALLKMKIALLQKSTQVH
jgi:hypothetical protein